MSPKIVSRPIPRVVRIPVLLALIFSLLLSPVGIGQDPDTIDPLNPLENRKMEAALGALEERARIVGVMLLNTSRDYRRVAVEQSATLQELMDMQAELDRAAVRVRDLTIERLEVVRQQRDKVAQRYAAHDAESGQLLLALKLLLNERDALTRRIADLRSNLPREDEMISGVWEVTWLPASISGTFYLDQSGTLVTGQYRLGSLGSGSLRGTFVGSKLYLERVDSEKGRDAELEGYLDPDNLRIRGTWQAFEMVQGGLPHGQWVAHRVE